MAENKKFKTLKQPLRLKESKQRYYDSLESERALKSAREAFRHKAYTTDIKRDSNE